jgi:pyridoxal phosphate phosphatase PHOSPHO2
MQTLKKKFDPRVSFTELLRSIITVFKEDIGDIEKLKDAIQSIDLIEGYADLFKFIDQNRSQITPVLITGSSDLLAEWLLEKHNLSNFFYQIHAHVCLLCPENFIKVEELPNHKCKECNVSQCKGEILLEYLIKDNYDTLIFVGDGDNDFCAGKSLRVDDYFFVRENMLLHKIIKERREEIKCENLILWQNGYLILENLKKII